MQKIDSQMMLFEQEMKKCGLRITSTRREIFKALFLATDPLSKQEIVRHIKDSHFVSVYRSLDVLLRHNLIKQVPRGFRILFELADTFLPHHHHVTCEKCGSSVAIHDVRIEKLMEEITLASGLRPTKHHFEMYGVCLPCQNAKLR